MVSDVAELTRILRQTSVSGTNGSFRARLREVSEEIRAELASTGRAILTDEMGNRYLIQREPGARGTL